MLEALDQVLAARPAVIEGAWEHGFNAAWSRGDIPRAMQFVDLHLHHQASLRSELGLECAPLVLSRDVLRGYTVQAYLDTHLKAMKLGWAPSRTVIALTSKRHPATNPVMARYWGRYITVVQLGDREPSGLAAAEKLFGERLTIGSTLHGRSVYIEHAKAQVQAEWERQNRSPLLTFDQADASGCASEMETLGLPAGAPFVTLHVRDNGSKTGSWENSGTLDDYRNADVLTYLQAVDLITQRGWYVVRVGDPGMKPIPPMRGLIDYAHSPIRSNLLDIYLFSQCRFFIGTSSGPILTPHVFGTPIVGTNYAPLSARLHAGNTLLLPKRLRDRSGRCVPFREALMAPVSSLFQSDLIRAEGYEYLDNSSDEIAAAVEEMLETLDGTIEYSDEDERLSASVNEVYADLSGYGALGRLARDYLRRCGDLQMI